MAITQVASFANYHTAGLGVIMAITPLAQIAPHHTARLGRSSVVTPNGWMVKE